MNLERRQYERTIARTGDVLHQEYKCVDFSEIGMRFSATVEVSRGETFTTKLQALAEPITLHCRVVWCRELVAVDGGRFEFGVTFEGFSTAKQAKLRELIDSRRVEQQA